MPEPKELELKFKQGDSFAQHISFELQKIASKKRSIEEKASAELVSVLNKSYAPVRIISVASSLDYEYERGHSGKITVEAEVVDKKGIKRINVDIPFKADLHELPKLTDLDKLVEATASEQDKLLISMDKETKEKLAKIDAEVALEAQKVEEALKPEGLKKTAEAYIQPPEASVSPVLWVNKHFLPASLEIGAVVDFGDAKYKLVNKSGGALSKDPNSGSQWGFLRVWESSDTSPSYRVNNY